MTAHAENAHAAEPAAVVPVSPSAPVVTAAAFDPRTGAALVWLAEIEAAVGGGVLPVAGLAHAEDAQGAIPYDFAPAAGVETIRVSDRGWRGREGDPGGATPYPPVLSAGPDVERRVALAPGGEDTYAWGSLNLGQPGTIPGVALAGRDTAMRRVRIRAGQRGWDTTRGRATDPRAADLVDAFSGLAMTWRADARGAIVPLRDPGAWLDAPISTRRFLGTGGAEGTADMAGRPWPVVRGGSLAAPVRACPVVLVNATTRIYRWTDGAGTVVAVREDGATNYTPAGDVPDVHAASAPAAGSYITSNATGEIRLGSDPVGQITVDGIGGAGPTAVGVLRDMLVNKIGLPVELLNEGSFLGAAEAVPYAGGWAWAGDETGRAAIAPLLAALGARLVATRGGGLRLWPLRALPTGTAPVARFDRSSAVAIEPVDLPAPLSPPAAFWTVGYDRTHQTTTTPKATVTAAERERLAQPWRTASWADAANLTRYAQAGRPPLVETALLQAIEATALATALGALWGVPRTLWQVTAPAASVLLREIGDPVQLVWPADGLRGGALGQVVGDGLRGGEATASLLVLV
jgi:hypothetical protein